MKRLGSRKNCRGSKDTLVVDVLRLLQVLGYRCAVEVHGKLGGCDGNIDDRLEDGLVRNIRSVLGVKSKNRDECAVNVRVSCEIDVHLADRVHNVLVRQLRGLSIGLMNNTSKRIGDPGTKPGEKDRVSRDEVHHDVELGIVRLMKRMMIFIEIKTPEINLLGSSRFHPNIRTRIHRLYGLWVGI